MNYNEQNCECHALTQQVDYFIKRPNKNSGTFGLGQINMYGSEYRAGITLGRALAPLAHRNYVWRTLDPAGGHINALLLETALKSVHSGP